MNNENQVQTVASTFQTMKIIHAALCAGVFLFTLVTLYLTLSPQFDFNYRNDYLIIILPIAAVGATYISNLVYNKLLIGIPKELTLLQKLSKYQIAMIVRMAMLEGIALFSIVWFMLTNNLFFLIVGVMLLFYMVSLFPNKNKISEVLKLTEAEKRELF